MAEHFLQKRLTFPESLSSNGGESL